MNWQSWIVLGIIVAVVAAIVIHEINNRRKGKSSCACGGNCGACGVGCGCHQDALEPSE